MTVSRVTMATMPKHRLALVTVIVLLASGCGRSSSTLPAGGATPTSATPPGPTVSGADFTIRMPIEIGDAANNAYGLWPYGVHGGGHAADGHPGWDIEYRPGATAVAAAAGTVQSVVAATTPGAVGVQLTHAAGGRTCRTVYQNIGTLAPGIVVGAGVSAGQAIGIPVTQTLMIGSASVTFAMIHFQVDDFSAAPGGLTNPNAVGPDAVLDAGGRAVFDLIWNGSVYNQELCEPFPSNPRGAAFPLTRTWTRQSGAGAARIEFTRLDVNTNRYLYSLFDDRGVQTDSGTIELSTSGRPPSVMTLQPAGGGARRMGLFDIQGETMRLAVGAPGGSAPGSLVGAAVYHTPR